MPRRTACGSQSPQRRRASYKTQGRSGGIWRLAEIGSCGASMQLLRNAVFSAPISFFVFASLRQAVRFTCFAAAASLATRAGAVAAGAAAGAVPVVVAGVAGVVAAGAAGVVAAGGVVAG